MCDWSSVVSRGLCLQASCLGRVSGSHCGETWSMCRRRALGGSVVAPVVRRGLCLQAACLGRVSGSPCGETWSMSPGRVPWEGRQPRGAGAEPR